MRWVALERLAMKDFRDVTGLKALIETIYGLLHGTAEQHFKIGSLASLRGSILHSAKTPNISGDLLQYVSLIYFDALLHKLGQPFEGRAKASLDAGNGALANLAQCLAVI